MKHIIARIILIIYTSLLVILITALAYTYSTETIHVLKALGMAVIYIVVVVGSCLTIGWAFENWRKL